jgi:hypothetical protein
MQLVLHMLLRVNRLLNELDPFEQSHDLNEEELDLSCARFFPFIGNLKTCQFGWFE